MQLPSFHSCHYLDEEVQSFQSLLRIAHHILMVDCQTEYWGRFSANYHDSQVCDVTDNCTVKLGTAQIQVALQALQNV